MQLAAGMQSGEVGQGVEILLADWHRFIGFFGADLVVVPGDQAQERLNEFYEFCRDEVLRATPRAARRGGGTATPV